MPQTVPARVDGGVAGQNHPDVMADPGERLREAEDRVAKSSFLGERGHFGGNHEDAQCGHLRPPPSPHAAARTACATAK